MRPTLALAWPGVAAIGVTRCRRAPRPPELPVGIFYTAPSVAAALSARPPFWGANCRYSLQGDPGRAAFRLLRRAWPTDEYHQQFMKFTTDGRLVQTIGVKGQRSDTGLPEHDVSSAA